MSVKAKCHNYTGCLIAYRGEEIELASNVPLFCPECGKALTVSHSGGGGIAKIAICAVIAAAIAAGIYFAYPYIISSFSPKTDVAATPAPSTSSTGTTGETPTSTGGTVANVGSTTSAEPPSAPVAPAKIDLNISKAETQNLRDEVLKRIDLMPNITQANKDKLYNSVQRARSMGLIVTIPFANGNARITQADIPLLKQELDKPPIAKLRDDPTAVFVILGYADPKGDEKKNLSISQTRADSVLEAMRDKCGVANVMHGVAMGGSKIIDANKLEKNRVAEVWVVLP